MITRYELAVHLAIHKATPRLKRIIRVNGLVHLDKGKAMIAARKIKKEAGAAIEWINVSSIKSVAKV